MNWKRLLSTVHLVALGLWLGTLVMTGVAAAILFPTVKALDPVIPSYSAYTGEHWRIVAGKPANMVFLYSDIIQFGCCIFAMASLLGTVLLLGSSWKRLFVGVRVVLLTGAMCVFGWSFMVHTPAMNAEAGMYWRAAEAGENDIAATHQQRFAAMHPAATKLLGTTTLIVLASLIAGAWGASEPPEEARSTGGLEEPALARGAR
jgi:hypothetical protein